MKKIVKKLSVLLACVLALGLVACGNKNSDDEKDVLAKIKDAGEIKVAIAPGFPPYEFYILDDEGKRQLAGNDVDLSKAIAEEIGVEANFVTSDFNAVLANLQSASVDMGISGLTATKKRAETMQFSDGYLQESSGGFQGIMMHQDKAAEYSTLEDIKAAKLQVGAQGGSIQYEMAQNITDLANIKQYATLDAGITALNAGDIDAMVVSTTSAAPLISSFPELEILPQEEFDLDPEKIYSTVVVAFPLGEEYASLIEVVNKVIKENVENGNLEKWHEANKALADSSAVEADE